MMSWIGRSVAIATLVWLGSASAQATSLASAVCLQAVNTGAGFADCRQTQYVGSLPGVEVAGWGEAHANLHTGVLRSVSVAEGERSGTDPADTQGAHGNSIAEFIDTITIGGGYSGPVELRMDVSGSFALNIPYGSYGASTLDPTVTPQLFMADPSNPNVLDTEAVAFVRQYPGQFLVHVDYASTQGSASLSTNANSSGNFADPTDVRLVLTTMLQVTPSNPTFTFDARLGTSTGINALALLPGDTRLSQVDFGNTADLSLILPAGVPWTSESGLFLQSVPEPGAQALLAAGTLWLTVLGRIPVSRSRGARPSQ